MHQIGVGACVAVWCGGGGAAEPARRHCDSQTYVVLAVSCNVINREGSIFAKIRHAQCFSGGGLSPFDCWLCLRGMRSLGQSLWFLVRCTRAPCALPFPDDEIFAARPVLLAVRPDHAACNDFWVWCALITVRFKTPCALVQVRACLSTAGTPWQWQSI